MESSITEWTDGRMEGRELSRWKKAEACKQEIAVFQEAA
jgi:hypothetical protein